MGDDQAQLPRATAIELACKEVETKKQVFEAKAFSEMLDAVETSHLSYDIGENNEDVLAVGFAFTSWNSEIYAVSVPVPSSRFIRNQREIERAVLTARQQAISLFVE